MISIIRLDDSYIDRLVELERLCFPKPWTKDMFLGELRADSAYYYIAVDNGKVIGYIGMWLAAGDCSITNIAVHPTYRRRGIASLLLDKISEHNPEIISLEVRKSNLAAIRLYEKHGFVKAGERKNYYADNGEDAILMIKAPHQPKGND